MAEAFRAYALDTPQTARTLRARLADRIGELAVQVSSGYAQDWGDYRQRVGVIEGLKSAMDVCDQVTKEEER